MAEKVSFEQALSELTQVATKITNEIYQVAKDQGENALNLILAVYRFEGIASLIIGGVLLALAITTGILAVKLCKGGQESSSYEPWQYFAAAPTIVASIVFTTVSADKLLDMWNWAAAIEPKIYLAHMFLNKIGM